MKTEIKSCLDTLRYGDSQSYQHISVIPLHGAANGAPPYIALADAMGAKTLTVTEVSDCGRNAATVAELEAPGAQIVERPVRETCLSTKLEITGANSASAARSDGANRPDFSFL